jgi:hypothetical protein
VNPQAPPLVAPGDDPRAVAGIRRTKAWCGLGGFAVSGFGAYGHGDLFFAAAERALVGGVAGYLLGWAVAVAVWRRLLRAEAQRVLEMLRERSATKTPES